MRWEVFAWAALAFVLIAAETLVPGAFLLWLGFAAAAVFLIVLLVPGMSLLVQVGLFIVLSFVSVAIYRTWFRGRGRDSDQPMLNRRAEQMVGQVAVLGAPIIDGEGRTQIGDAFWNVEGPDLPAGTRVRVVAIRGMTLQVVPA